MVFALGYNSFLVVWTFSRTGQGALIILICRKYFIFVLQYFVLSKHISLHLKQIHPSINPFPTHQSKERKHWHWDGGTEKIQAAQLGIETRASGVTHQCSDHWAITSQPLTTLNIPLEWINWCINQVVISLLNLSIFLPHSCCSRRTLSEKILEWNKSEQGNLDESLFTIQANNKFLAREFIRL